MRIQLALGYWPWISYEDQLVLAARAEEAGLDGVWVSEAWGQDAVSILAILADRTERIHLGSALMQIPARPPTTAAMAAATIDVISAGRFRMGLGVSGPQVSEGWYGVPFTRPLARTREYVEIVRKVWAREVVAYDGEEFQLPSEGGTGLGKPLKLMISPVQERLPIYLGAIGPKAVMQTGEIADGWLPAFFNPHDCAELLDGLDRGLERSGRGREAIEVAPLVPVSVEDKLEDAQQAVKPFIAFYLGGMGAKGKNFYVDLCERYGFGAEANEIQDCFLAGDRMGAVNAVTEDIIEVGSIACTPDDLPDRLGAYQDAGADSLVAMVFGSDRAATIEQLAGFAPQTGGER
jgi:F420-dependent oxidoreductase-like protein